MKHWGVLISGILLLFIPLSLGAETLYVTAKVCYVYDKASAGGAKLLTLKQGDKVEVLLVQDKWIQVKAGEKGTQGWANKLFLGATSSVTRADVGAGMSDLSSVATRTRASAYTTSAAATRGLSSDNVRQRENLSFSSYDFTIAPWLDTFVVSEDEVLAFAVSEGLAF